MLSSELAPSPPLARIYGGGGVRRRAARARGAAAACGANGSEAEQINAERARVQRTHAQLFTPRLMHASA